MKQNNKSNENLIFQIEHIKLVKTIVWLFFIFILLSMIIGVCCDYYSCHNYSGISLLLITIILIIMLVIYYTGFHNHQIKVDIATKSIIRRFDIFNIPISWKVTDFSQIKKIIFHKLLNDYPPHLTILSGIIIFKKSPFKRKLFRMYWNSKVDKSVDEQVESNCIYISNIIGCEFAKTDLDLMSVSW